MEGWRRECWRWGCWWGREGTLSPNLATVSSVMTPPSLWRTILFCLHLHGSSFFLLFCSQKTHGTFANIFKSCEKQDFFFCWFFKSSTSQVFLFKACLTMPSSSWLVLNAAGLWERWEGGGGGRWRRREREREREEKKTRLEKSY